MTILTPSHPSNVAQETIRDDAACPCPPPQGEIEKKCFRFFETVCFTKCGGGIKFGNFQIQWKNFGTTENR
jgi:hypothetical protein